MNENKFRKIFSQNSSGQQNVTFLKGLQRLIRNFQVHFLTNSPPKTVMSEDSFERVRKNQTVEKKIIRKTGPKKKLWPFLWNFFSKKKSKNFQKKILKVVISFLNMATKKKFFFLKIFSAQISTQILKMSLFAGRSNFEKNCSEIFFHSYFMTKGTV